MIRRLTIITSLTPENENLRIDELYPTHAEALARAGLAPSEYPTLWDFYDKIQQQQTENEGTEEPESTAKQAKKDRDKARSIYLYIGYSKIWGKPIHARVK